MILDCAITSTYSLLKLNSVLFCIYIYLLLINESREILIYFWFLISFRVFFISFIHHLRKVDTHHTLSKLRLHRDFPLGVIESPHMTADHITAHMSRLLNFFSVFHMIYIQI